MKKLDIVVQLVEYTMAFYNSISPDNGSFLVKVQEFRNNADYNLSKGIGLREVERFKLTCKAILEPYLIQLD